MACLDLFAERTQRVLLTARAEKTPLEALEFFFERHLSRPARGRASLGCMLVNTLLELAGVDDDASDRASRRLADTGVVVANHGLDLLPVFFGDMTKLAWTHSCWCEAGRRRIGAQAIEPDPSMSDRMHHLIDTVAHLRTRDERFADLPGYPWPARCLETLLSLGGLHMHYLDERPRLAPVIGQSATAGAPATTSNADPGRRRSSARPRPETARSQRG